MELKIITNNSSMLVSTKVVAFFVGKIRWKINAILIGFDGIGLVNQIREIINKIPGFSLLSMENGCTKKNIWRKNDLTLLRCI